MCIAGAHWPGDYNESWCDSLLYQSLIMSCEWCGMCPLLHLCLAILTFLFFIQPSCLLQFTFPLSSSPPLSSPHPAIFSPPHHPNTPTTSSPCHLVILSPHHCVTSPLISPLTSCHSPPKAPYCPITLLPSSRLDLDQIGRASCRDRVSPYV